MSKYEPPKEAVAGIEAFRDMIPDDQVIRRNGRQWPLEMRKEEFQMIMDRFLHEYDSLDNVFFLEFGVFQGQTVNYFANLLKEYANKRNIPVPKIYGFDSFIGLPEEWDLGKKYYSKGHFNLNGNLPQVEDNVVLVKGFFEDSLEPWIAENLNEDSRIAYLNIDSDIYSAAVTILELLNPWIKEDTVLRFDEFTDWRLVNNIPFDLPPQPYPKWPEHEWPQTESYCD